MIILDMDFIYSQLKNLKEREKHYRSTGFIEFLIKKQTFKLLAVNNDYSFFETELSINTKRNPFVSNVPTFDALNV